MQNLNSAILNFEVFCIRLAIGPHKKSSKKKINKPAKIPLTFINLNPLLTPSYKLIFAADTNIMNLHHNNLNFEFQKHNRSLI